MTNKKLLKYLSITGVLVAISSIRGYITLQTGISIGNVTIWWLIHMGVIYLFFRGKGAFFDNEDKYNMRFIHYYLLWNIFEILRGSIVASSYWDWKGLISNAMALLIPIVAYAASNKIVLQSILQYYLKFGLPLFILFFFLTSPETYGFYLVPITLLIFFVPAMTHRWKLMIAIFTMIVLVADLSARSNVIKFSIPVLLLSIYMLRHYISKRFLEIIRKILFIIPFVLFTLAISDIFNVFKMDDYIEGSFIEIKKNDTGEIVEANLKADTRTKLYQEVLQTAQKYNTWILGRSPARGNETVIFEALADITNRTERLGNEVAILNIFTWTGLVGVFFYFIIFFKASSLALNRSNNIYCKMLGIFIAFRWLYAWVEDINYFTLTTFFLWFTIALCYSKSFRAMSDKEMKYWIRGIFDKKYRIIAANQNLSSLNHKDYHGTNSVSPYLPQS